VNVQPNPCMSINAVLRFALLVEKWACSPEGLSGRLSVEATTRV
jgi:hypothetical protein